MGRIKGVSKTCPECYEQFTGNKCYCSIGFSKRKSKKSSNKDVKIRRTERVKRGKPDYYDVLEYERQARRERKQKPRAKLDLSKQVKADKPSSDIIKSNRMHLKEKKIKKDKKIEVETPPKEEELEEIILSKETIAKFDLILQDINKKIYASSWRDYTELID